MQLRKRILVAGMVTVGLLLTGVWVWAQVEVGSKVDEYRGVVVYANGLNIAQSHGRHYAADGYYYGQKWQCVEYVKRFFHQAHGHAMPDVWGHAKDFWDNGVKHGVLNPKRGLLQYRNGNSTPPAPGDLVVFTNGSYGHVAIVTEVKANTVEVVQQNIFGRPRDTFAFKSAAGTNWMGQGYAPAGWLRMPGRNPASQTGSR